MQVTKEYLVESHLCSFAIADKWIDPINATLERFEINTQERIAAFLAQCAHESGHFSVVKENLNYSAQALMRVFPKYFPMQDVADQYNRQPEKIANRVYGNRMGNGPESSGDGYKYCGRGLIQLTGKDNYVAFSKFVDKPEIIDNPELVETPEFAALSAGWFWHKSKLNDKAADVKAVTRVVNGGYNGLDERERLFAQAMAVQVA